MRGRYNRAVTTRLGATIRGWTVPLLAGVAVSAAAWILVTRWGAVLHGHPAYLVLIVLTLLVAGGGCWRWTRRRGRAVSSPARRVGSVLGIVFALVWIALLLWLRPFAAQSTALAAMRSDAQVRVSESATQITMTPTGVERQTRILFQPGARVDARAYAAHLRPLAAAGYLVVIVKQPLGIAFLAKGALDAVVSAAPAQSRWVVGGHSLGGTVAAMEAQDLHRRTPDRLAGLVLWGSYPAGRLGDLTPAWVLSISGSRDGLSTPAKIDRSRADLPRQTYYEVIDGGCHAQFGDYGAQPGDGAPTLSDDEARAKISAATLAALEGSLRQQ